MDDDTLTDLKQFIAATVSQQTSEISQRLEKVDERLYAVDKRLDKVDRRFNGLERKMDEIAVFVTDALDTTNDTTGEQLKDHELRIKKLERASS